MALLPKRSLTRDLIIISLAIVFIWIFGMKMESAQKAQEEALLKKQQQGQL